MKIRKLHLPLHDTPWLPSLQLGVYDKNVILNKEHLQDKIIHAAQGLLKAQFSQITGFQDPVLKDTTFTRQSKAYKFILQTFTSIQIHHMGDFHWVCSSSNKEGLYVFNTSSSNLSDSLSIQLSEIYQKPGYFTYAFCTNATNIAAK